MAKPDGGPAFPFVGTVETVVGMSLRDWMAGMALAGMIALFAGERNDIFTPAWRDAIAAECGWLADALLAEREKGGGK